MSVFDIVIHKFFKILVDNYQYDLKILETEWNNINHEMKTNIKFDIVPTPSVDDLVDELNNLTITTSTTTTSTSGKCPYKLTRGIHANTLCDAKVKPGYSVCSKHIKYENGVKKIEKPVDKNKPRLKLTTKQVSNPGTKLEFLNTCKSIEEENNCINFDELQVHEINKMFKEVLDSNDYKDKNLTLEEIFWDKKKKLVEFYKDKQPIKITFTKWNQIEHSLTDVVSFRTNNDVILNLVRYKQSKYYVDKNSLVIVKSVDEPLVIGRINRYEQPTLEIDGYTYDLILKHNFEFDSNYLNNEGKEAHEAFLKSKSLKGLTPIVDNTIPEENKKF